MIEFSLLVLSLLKSELMTCMQLMGAKDISEIKRDMVIVPHHPMSGVLDALMEKVYIPLQPIGLKSKL